MFKDAKRPGDEANPVGIDISVTGEVASAMSDKLSKPSGGTSFWFYQLVLALLYIYWIIGEI